MDTGTPIISASYSDSLSGIDVSSVVLKVDGTNVTSEATVTETGVSYTPTTALEDGTRSVQLTVYDRAGNMAYRAWSFIVDVDTSVPDTTPPSDWAFWAFTGSIVAGILAITAITIFIWKRRHSGT